ncbi:MAG: hypothetical protein HS115_14165 [Spirochaetales bacterium]|nr:hypothetical protein [Spirochaetales bacterium]
MNTLRDLRPVADQVIVIGSEVPNLSRIHSGADLFVSQDIDLAVPIENLERTDEQIPMLFEHYRQSSDEPSILLPRDDARLEINFLGVDFRSQDLDDISLHRGRHISFLAFGTLTLIKPVDLTIEKHRFRVAEHRSLFLEKILTERSSIKGERDLYVAALVFKEIQSPQEIIHMREDILALDSERKFFASDNLASLILMIEKGHPDLRNSVSLLKELLAGVGLP